MYTSMAQVPTDIKVFYKEELDEQGRTILVLDKPEEVSYEYVHSRRDRRHPWEVTKATLARAIVWEHFDVNHNQYLVWREEYEQWEREQPFYLDLEDNKVYYPAPERPVVDYEARKACYEIIYLPNDEPNTNTVETFSDVVDDEQFTITRKHDTVPFTDAQMRELNKNVRDEGRYAPITVRELTFDMDPESMKNVQGAITSWDTLVSDEQLLANNLVVDGKMVWTMEDNSVTLVTKVDLQDALDAAAVRASMLQAAYLISKGAK